MIGVGESRGVSKFDQAWGELCSFLSKWYASPDFDALRIVYCTYISHLFFQDRTSVWLLILGLPRSGKTQLAIEPLAQFGNVEEITELTVNSLLSGYGENIGLLKRLHKIPGDTEGRTQAVLTFPDLTTTLLSVDPGTRTHLIGILRRVADGQYEREVGSKSKKIRWRGKITGIAACTPELERLFTLNQELGERWIKIRWRTSTDTKEYSLKALSHIGHEGEIRSSLHKLVANLIDCMGEGCSDECMQSYHSSIISLAELVETCRTSVRRESRGSKYSVVGLGSKQIPTMIAKDLLCILRAATVLRGADLVNPVDLRLVGRLALDNIPDRKRIIIASMIAMYPSMPTKADLYKRTKFARATFYREIEDLHFLEVIEDEELEESNRELDPAQDLKERATRNARVKLTAKFVSLLRECRMIGR